MARRNDDDRDTPRRRPDRPWSTRIAWMVLIGGAAVLLTRTSVATVVQVHGDGMAPTIMDGDYILLVRGRWMLEHGDIVVYAPEALRPLGPKMPELDDLHPEGATEPQGGARDAARPPAGELRNTSLTQTLRDTAVVDVAEVERNWEKVSESSTGKRRKLRVGRILAVPGDRVTFNALESPLGVLVNGQPIDHKPSEPLRILLRGQEDVPRARMRATAYESHGDRRYPVLVGTGPVQWQGMALPASDLGPVDSEAEGYLILADNRDEGACCDSRALGWIAADSVRGEITVRIGGNPEAAPDLDPNARRWTVLP